MLLQQQPSLKVSFLNKPLFIHLDNKTSAFALSSIVIQFRAHFYGINARWNIKWDMRSTLLEQTKERKLFIFISFLWEGGGGGGGGVKQSGVLIQRIFTQLLTSSKVTVVGKFVLLVEQLKFYEYLKQIGCFAW